MQPKHNYHGWKSLRLESLFHNPEPICARSLPQHPDDWDKMRLNLARPHLNQPNKRRSWHKACDHKPQTVWVDVLEQTRQTTTEPIQINTGLGSLVARPDETMSHTLRFLMCATTRFRGSLYPNLHRRTFAAAKTSGAVEDIEQI
jgi:hypothetical protein